VVSDYINTMKTTFLFKFWLLTSFFRVYKLSKRSFFIDSFSLFLCFMCIHAFKKLDINRNWNRKSSSLYWYNRLPLYLFFKVYLMKTVKRCFAILAFNTQTIDIVRVIFEYSLDCTMYIVLCTVYSLQCIVSANFFIVSCLPGSLAK